VGGNNSDTVGNTSGDFAAQVPGLIVTAEGSFISVTPGISEEGNTYYTPPNTPPNNCSVPTKTNVANTFTLQLNTNIFPISLTSVCIDPVYVKCGWQQFVFDNYAAVAKNGQQLAQAYMQYWLIGYGAACLPGWSQSSSGCYRNSPSSAPIPAQTMADLSGMTITATADSGGTDTLIVQTAGGDLTALGSDSLLHLAQRWDAAEFNIFGDGCASQANFSSGSTIVVKTSVVDSSLDTPTWVQESFTGETDNLNLVPTPCVYGKPSPAIEFMETNAANPVATCFSSGLQAFTTLASFNGTDGSNPYAGLVQATNGNLYGTTSGGGAANEGTVFKIAPSGTLTTIYSFCSQSGCTDGDYPLAGLVQATNGDLYGTTALGGGANSGGTVFKIAPSGTLTTLHSFCSQANCADGKYPSARLVQATNGDLYGTTFVGGTYNAGTVFKITPSGALMTLHSFCFPVSCADGGAPGAGLVQATNGYLYGTTDSGGAHNEGTVFKITPSGALTTLYSFCPRSGCTDGADPSAELVQATDGYLYGTTSLGGAYNEGTVFKITPSGALTTLYSFCSQSGCTDGENPEARLVQATDGDLYGTTANGGANGYGTVFKITPSGALVTLYSSCSQSGCTDGEYTLAGLVQPTNGDLYGTTLVGGANNGGTVFSLSVGLGPFVETLPTSGPAGTAVEILGTNLTGATSVTFNGAAAAFTVVSPSLITTTVPTGATTGKVQVVIPNGTLSSNVPFRVP
jgi:uncharacterized repeat protein (TIGR03803 family)